MGLLDYNSFLRESVTLLNESALVGGEFDCLQAFINKKGLQTKIDYVDILKEPEYQADASSVLNELNRFEIFLANLQSNATTISTMAENLVAIVFGGDNSNDASGINTIFSDVNIPKGSPTVKVSVKSSKKSSPSGVLSNTPIKFNQILSVLFSKGESEVRETEFETCIEDIKNNKKPNVFGGNYGIAVVYSDGNDAIIERTNDLSADSIWAAVRSAINEIGPSFLSKGEWDLASVSRLKKLGWMFDTKVTIVGKSPAEIKIMAQERNIILKNIEINLSNKDLKDVATEYGLSTTDIRKK